MGPIGCSLLKPAVCIAKNLYSFITIWLQWVLVAARGTFMHITRDLLLQRSGLLLHVTWGLSPRPGTRVMCSALQGRT